MQCPTPISIKDKSDTNPKNIPSKRLQVPCGRCGICRQARRNQWAFRLQQELKDSENAYFITLTYSDETLPEFIDYDSGQIKSNLVKRDLQLFFKRLRREQFKETKERKFRYYAVGEYGTETDRAHYHLIGFNIDRSIIDRLTRIWGHGHVHVGTVTQGSILYVAKYHVNRDMEADENGRTKEFATMSKRPAIGHGYIERNKQYHLDNMNNYVIQNGYKKAMPRYYKDKIFQDLDKETINIKMEKQLDKIYEKQQETAERMGIDDPIRHIFDATIHHASKYKQKINKKNIF